MYGDKQQNNSTTNKESGIKWEPDENDFKIDKGSEKEQYIVCKFWPKVFEINAVEVATFSSVFKEELQQFFIQQY